MARCDYDVIFYRVFCLTLLGIAFIFTVILTNVFVDIDGLLSRNDKVKQPTTQTPEKILHAAPDDHNSDMMYKEDNYEDEEEKYRSRRSLDPKVIIKTVIHVKSRNDNVKHTSPKESKQIVELIYNGQRVQIDDDKNNKVKSFESGKIKISDIGINTGIYQDYKQSNMKPYKTIESFEDKQESIKSSKLFVTKVIKDHLKKYMNNIQSTYNAKKKESKRKLTTKRIKRQIKIKYNLEPTNQTKDNNTTKNNDDELFVEIETHFDGQGIKAEKKKKLIKQVIDKIRRAIHSQTPVTNKTKTYKHVQVKKRIQNPLDTRHETMLIHKEAVPLETVIHRNIEPIEKFIAHKENVDIRNRFDENRDQPNAEHIFATASKSLHSAQLGEIDVDYNNVLNLHAIPQRFQIPLNVDTSEETFDSNYFNTGNMKFIIKDIDGSGFSVGFNQYTDAAPDSEAIKLFTGVENLIKAYHRNYDQATSGENEKQNNIRGTLDKNYEYVDNSNERNDRPDYHTIIRRSIKQKNSYSSELKLDFQHLNTHNYTKKTLVSTNKEKKRSIPINKHKPKNNKQSEMKLLQSIIDDDLLDQGLQPEKVYDIASLFNRKKRTIAVKKYSNHMSKKKVYRFLNFKKLGSKSVFISKKRNKRNIGNIDFMAPDDTQKLKQSEEHIFVLSDEGMLADRATIREIETPEDLGLIDQTNNKDPHYEFISSADSQPDLPFGYIPPENSLMSKYPHIFMEEGSHRYDDIIPEVSDKLRSIPTLSALNTKQDEAHTDDNNGLVTKATTENYIQGIESIPRVQEIVNAISPNSPKTKYKFTVKIIPNKNMTDLNGGFKEIHTSINKSFNRDGLLYSTLVNMSEISKIENLFKLRDTIKSTTVMPIHRKREQQKIQSIIRNRKDRVDQQLSQLQKEKAHLETMMVKNDLDSNDYVDIILPSNPSQKIHLKASDVYKLAASALMTLQQKQDIQTPLPTTEAITSVSTITTTPVATTAVTTSTTTTPTTISPERIRIIKTIEKNDNLTKEILNKIDRNTEILQTFLEKLSDSIGKLRQQENQTENNRATISSNNGNDWHTYQTEQMFDKPRDGNLTSYRIPFLYAYQQPYGFVNKPDSPMASIIYKGHIHTNTIERISEPAENNNDNKMKANNNLIARGRFFIDGIETGYRGIPKNNTMINEDFVKVNNTVQRLI